MRPFWLQRCARPTVPYLDQGKVVSLKCSGVQPRLRAHSVSHRSSLVWRRIPRRHGRPQTARCITNRGSSKSPSRQDATENAAKMPKGTAIHRPICRPLCRASSSNLARSVGARCAQISGTSGDWNGDHVDSESLMACTVCHAASQRPPLSIGAQAQKTRCQGAKEQTLVGLRFEL